MILSYKENMRKPKTLKTELIHLIEETWKNTKKGTVIETQEQSDVVAAINYTLLFFELFDMLRGENRKEYFIKRHLSLSNNLSQLQISGRYNICQDTVGEYCAMNIRVFEKCFNAVKEMRFDIEEFKSIAKMLLPILSRFMVQNRIK